jgi:hypothetical protein
VESRLSIDEHALYAGGVESPMSAINLVDCKTADLSQLAGPRDIDRTKLLTRQEEVG